ncbi:MAG: hypothetical protein Q9195_000080 [Heterodermia aff. obscurata]
MSTLRARRSINASQNLIRKCYTTSGFNINEKSLGLYGPGSSVAEARARAKEVKDVAILGGGITGLASAFYLSKQLPEARITIFEGSSLLGGWLHSKQVDVGNGSVVFEQGPRTLRPNIPNGLVTLNLVRHLGLEDQILFTSKNSVAAQNRYVYYPDHLVRMPGRGRSVLQNLNNIWKEPVFNGLFLGVFKDWWARPRPVDLTDESVGSFFTRRFHSKIVDNLISAILHGVYAGDVYQLSMRSIMPLLWNYEQQYGGILEGFRENVGLTSFNEFDWMMLRDLEEDFEKDSATTAKLQEVANSSVFTFRKGLGELSDRLEAHLSKNSMVKIRRESLVTDLKLRGEGPGQTVQLETRSATGKSTGGPGSSMLDNQFTHVISTISSEKLSNIVRDDTGRKVLSHFQSTPSVTVMVVNLFFSNSEILPVHGFGYLIPRSVPFTENPERALGVVFDSDATIGQDEIGGTKVTVMLGGHWWDQWDTYPDEDEGASMAKAVLRRHLGISTEPDAIRVALQKDCIPQYTVGHRSRQKRNLLYYDTYSASKNETGKGFDGTMTILLQTDGNLIKVAIQPILL